MTDNQKNIIGTILLNMSASTLPVTEEMISNLVDMNDNMNTMMYGTPKLTPEEREEVITALHAALFVRIDRGHFVKENDHTPWYMAAKAENSSKFWDRYRLYLLKEKHWNGDTINELDKTTDEIMDLLGNPDQADGFMRRGLCIGDVQSGKTSTYIGLINKAADAHYRVIILLTGTIEKLRRQTQQRIDGNRQNYRRIDTHGIIVVERSTTINVYTRGRHSDINGVETPGTVAGMGGGNSGLQEQWFICPAVVQGEGNHTNHLLSLGTRTIIYFWFNDAQA